MHYVIIGASAAGISAAETLRRLDPDSEITVISKERETAYSRCLTTYYISDRISKDKLYLRTTGQLEDLKIRLLTGITADEVNHETCKVRLSDGNVISYDRLLAASGASPVIPDIPGIGGQGVYPLRTLSNAEDIRAVLPKVTSAVILGDGLVSVTTAMALNSKGLKVSIVGIAPHILATFLDTRSAQILQARMEALGIDFYLGRSLQEVRRDTAGNVTGAALTGGENISAGIVIIAVGVKPEFSFLKDTGVAAKHGILVNEFMESNLPGIYAAGDAAQGFDFVRKTPVWNPLWPNAVEQGSAAAYNMSGVRKPYAGCTNMNSLDIGGIPLVCVGTANEEQPDYESFVISSNDSTYEKLVFQGNRLIGFILLGKTEKAGVLTSLVSHDTITPTQKDKLLRGSFSFTSVAGLAPVGL